MKIAVIDGQGGGVGKQVVEKIKANIPSAAILALGTNALATAQMIKAGANEGATGENAIVFNVSRVDYIVGPYGIVMPNAMLGELTPLMATAIGSSSAVKVLIPINKCSVKIAGVKDMTLAQYIDDAVTYLGGLL